MAEYDYTLNQTTKVYQYTVAVGTPGLSAYMDAVASGLFTGTKEEWLASLRGSPGTPQKFTIAAGVTNGIAEIDNDGNAVIAGTADFELPAGCIPFMVFNGGLFETDYVFTELTGIISFTTPPLAQNSVTIIYYST